MKTLSFIHRWLGGLIGLALALIGLSGAILLWEGQWVQLSGANDPVAENVASIAAVSERAIADGAIRITFASEEIGLHHAAGQDGSGAYIAQDGTVVAQWASMWERPEFWIFDFHHYFFLGKTGETLTGLAGLAGLIFAITGAILWWRTRRAFEWRWWPRAMQPGPIVRHHRDLGIVTLPLLLVSLLTGLAMLYGEVARAVVGGSDPKSPPKVATASTSPAPYAAMLASAKARFPDAAIRRLSVPAKPDAPYSVRMRQPAEWTPNGRTTLYFDGQGTLLRADDALAGNRGDQIIETFYPVHSAKVGGVLWKIAMTISGLALAMLGSFAVYSFWIRRVNRRRQRRAVPQFV
jgi:uncharacterized iron-regulated membrane protein